MRAGAACLGLAVALTGCSRPYDCAEGIEQGQADLELVTPAQAVSGPWMPVLARIAEGDRDATFTMCLDGVDASDPLGFTRLRRAALGDGYDYVAAVDLEAVEAGAHDFLLVARAGTRTRYARQTVELVHGEHRVDLVVRDSEGQPAAARVMVLQEGVRLPFVTVPDDADPAERDRAVSSYFLDTGRGTLFLDSGSYEVVAVRGIRDELAVVPLQLTEDTEVTLTIERVVDLPDHQAADLHLHTGRSYDSFLPDKLRWRSLRAGGLDIAVITDHRQVVVPGPLLEHTPADAAPIFALQGYEHHVGESEGDERLIGHLNAFPVVPGSEAPFPPLRTPTLAATLGAFLERQVDHPFEDVGSELVLQLNHPRGIHFFPDRPPNRGAWSMFGALGLDHDAALGEGANAWYTEVDEATGGSMFDFDTMEILNRFSWPLYLEVRADWFWLLDEGVPITGTGNSDSHAMEVEVAGFPVNLVRTAPPSDGWLPFVEALQRGHVLVSTGPIVELTADGVQPGDLLRASGTVPVTVRVRAPSWVPVAEVRLVLDGEVVQTWPVGPFDGVLDRTFETTIPVGADTWVLAEAGHPLDSTEQPMLGGRYGQIVPGYVPIGFTNPVRIDGDGDGHWSGGTRQ